MLIPFGEMQQLWNGLEGDTLPIGKYSVIYEATAALELETHYNQATTTIAGATGADVARFGK
jgi:hypothetical protein